MLIQKLNDCEEIIAGDGTVLRELLHPDKQDINLRYSLAHAILPVGETSIPHSLKTSEVYYIISGVGEMSMIAKFVALNQAMRFTFLQMPSSSFTTTATNPLFSFV